MRAHERNKDLLDRFTLENIHEMCREFKRGMNPLDYRDRVVCGETDPEIIKKRFIPQIAGFFSQNDILDFASRHGIRTD